MNIGIIGCGKITRTRHGPECYNNSKINIAGFFDVIPNRAKELVEQYGGRVYISYQDMLADKQVDAVIVCTSNATHASITIDALNAGKHVLCEKPISINLEDAILMRETSRDTDKMLMIAHNQRYDLAHIKAKEILKSGVIGDVITFKTEFSHSGPDNWSIDSGNSTWFFNKDEAFLGSMGDLAVHKIDLMRWFLEDRFVSVMASVKTLDKRDASGNLIGIDDNAVCILTSKNGVIGTVHSSWTNYGIMNNSTIFYGTKGVLKIYHNPKYSISVETDLGVMTHKLNEQKNSGVVDAFVEAIITGESSPISAEEGIRGLSVILAAIKSCKEGKVITIV